MCEFCEQGEHFRDTDGTHKSDVSLAWQDGTWNIVTIARTDLGMLFTKVRTEFSVAYCPMCGRKLAEKGQ